jgi:integrase
MIRGKVTQKGGFSSKASAKGYLDFLLLSSLNVPVERPAPTVAQAWANYEHHLEVLNRSPRTIDYYRAKMVPLADAFGTKQLTELSQQMIEEYVTERKETVTTGTINAELTLLKILHKSSESPARWKLEKLSHQVQPRFVHPPEVVRKLWDSLSQPSRCAVGLTLLCALRAEDAWRAEASWVNGRVLTLPYTKTGAFSTWIVDTLFDVLPKKGPLVTLTSSGVRMELERVSKRLKISPPYRGVGSFRHHSATFAIDHCGYHHEDVKAILGHGKTITDRYKRTEQIPLKRKLLEDVERVVFGANK